MREINPRRVTTKKVTRLCMYLRIYFPITPERALSHFIIDVMKTDYKVLHPTNKKINKYLSYLIFFFLKYISISRWTFHASLETNQADVNNRIFFFYKKFSFSADATSCLIFLKIFGSPLIFLFYFISFPFDFVY